MRKLLLLATFLALPLAARAQVFSIYGTFSDTHLTNLVTGTSSNSTGGYTTSTTSHYTPGFGGGVTFGVLPLGPIHLGLDLRGSTKPGNDGSDLILAGPRLALKLPIIRIKPYIAAEAGYLRTRTTLVLGPLPAGTQNTSTYAAYEVLGGVDIPLLPILDLRAIEVGGGQGRAAFASSDGANTSLFTVNSGLVLHF